MSGVTIRADTTALVNVARKLAAGGRNVPAAIARALNRTQDQTKTKMVRALVVQTGLKRKTIVAAVRTSKKASAGSLTAVLGSSGGDIRLKFFAARETRAGVSAAPWGQRKVYAATFMRGGRFPNRTGGPFGGNPQGHVYMRSGRGRFPIKVARSGLFIPTEMVAGATEAAFQATVQSVLPGRLEKEVRYAIVSGK